MRDSPALISLEWDHTHGGRRECIHGRAVASGPGGTLSWTYARKAGPPPRRAIGLSPCEHELYYSHAPLHDAVALQQVSRTLKALAGHWMTAAPAAPGHANPYTGCDDLNVQAAIETLGVVFLEGEGEPAEIARIKRDLATMADDHQQTGSWLAQAMESTWASAAALLRIDRLADLLGERHRIIAANWQNAALNTIIAHLLRRAEDILELVELTRAAIREDLRRDRLIPRYIYSAAELIDRAADLLAEGSVLLHDSERRWRIFRERIAALRGGGTAVGEAGRAATPEEA